MRTSANGFASQDLCAICACVTTTYLYDGLNPVQERSPSGGTVNMLTGLGIDEVFTRTDATGRRTFFTDALGSTVNLTDDTGSLQTIYYYEPFGNTTPGGDPSTNSFQYTGRENDGTGLYYYRARYYSPRLQRFISEDPIGFFGGINFYSYALNNPISFSDPLGLDVTVKQYPGARGLDHIGLGVNTDNTVGHYPSHAADPMTMFFGGDVQGAIRPDSKFAPIEEIIIRTTPQQDQIMQKIIDEAMGNPDGRTYNLYGRNCATFVEDVLRAGGLQVPYTMLPKLLMDEIQKRYRR